jgi:hypothetical protein
MLYLFVGIRAAQENYASNHRRLNVSIAVEMKTVLKKIVFLLLQEVYIDDRSLQSAFLHLYRMR